ncbi:MAG TPA: hypothetical protein G4O00_02025 [Thermoflexia bacterium]|nr:hypothetical protein [Thermoflexia bacterium]
MPLIESYRLQFDLSPHSGEELEYEAIAHLPVDISEVLPYLNTVLGRGVYLPDEPALSWRHEGRNIGFWPDRIAVDHLKDRDEARQVIEELIALVNRVWDQRDEIKPDTTTHQYLQPLEVYKLLPQTNCGTCGEKGCFPFAVKLAAGEVAAESCRPLFEEPTYTERLEQLQTLLAAKWPSLQKDVL